MATDKEIIRCIWHHKIDDNFPWDECVKYLEQCEGIKISSQNLKKIFQKHFTETMGIEPYDTKCPKCQSALIIKYKIGYFIGCSSYPNCNFLASERKPYKKAKMSTGNRV